MYVLVVKLIEMRIDEIQFKNIHLQPEHTSMQRLQETSIKIKWGIPVKK